MLLVLWLLLLGTLAFINSANCWHPKLKLSLLSYGLWDCSLWPVVKQIPSAKVFVFSSITPTQGMGMRLYFCPETLPMLQACRSTQSKEFHQELVAADFASLLQRINSWNVPCFQLHPPACTGKEASENISFACCWLVCCMLPSSPYPVKRWWSEPEGELMAIRTLYTPYCYHQSKGIYPKRKMHIVTQCAIQF